MLAVVLTILKIIGIVLLCILGFILVMLILVLVLPVRYSIDVSKIPEEKLKARMKITYFFGIIRALATYEDVFEVKAKVLWFNIFSMKIPDNDADDEEVSLDDLDDAIKGEFPEDEQTGGESEYEYDIADEITDDEDAPLEEYTPENIEDSDDVNDTEDQIPDSEISHEDDFTDDMEDSNTSDDGDEGPLSKLKYKFDEICDKIDKVRSEIRYYYNIYNSNEGKNTLRNTGKHLKKIFRKILPRKISANLTYGFSSPDMTGKVYGIYCLIADRFSRDSEVIPDFDREIFEGSIRARGYFNLWGILINGIAVVLNKDAIKIIRSVKRHMKKKDSGTAEETEKAA
jgi:hypothetical protein